ncbi:mucin-1 isoform X3 [Hyalella azteca]|uniref:Mucin-1 isoform X3 n=1 Tax=Hyalella azteca TaxID=294128 RepID=A0A8B7N219_HYAAZ|nr:mucin-1 isoform X3 [Hyalella azteca]
MLNMHQGMGGLLHDPVVGVVGEDGKMPPMQCHPPFSMASLSSELGKIVGRIPGLTSDSPYSSGPHTPATPAGGHNPVDVVPETSSRTAAVSVGESPALGDACAAGGDATDCNIVTPSGADVVPVACTPSEGPATNTLVSPAHEAALTSAPGAISSSVLPCVAPPAALGTEPRRVSRFQVTKVNEASTPVLASPAAPQPPSIIGGAVASPASPSSAPPGWGGDAPSVKRGRFAVTKVQDLSPSTAAVPSPVTEIGAQRSPFTPQQQPSVPQSAMAHQSFIQTAPPQTPQPSLPLQQPQHQPQSQRHPQQATEMTRHNGCPPTHLPLQGHSSGGLGLSPSPLFTSDDDLREGDAGGRSSDDNSDKELESLRRRQQQERQELERRHERELLEMASKKSSRSHHRPHTLVLGTPPSLSTSLQTFPCMGGGAEYHHPHNGEVRHMGYGLPPLDSSVPMVPDAGDMEGNYTTLPVVGGGYSTSGGYLMPGVPPPRPASPYPPGGAAWEGPLEGRGLTSSPRPPQS